MTKMKIIKRSASAAGVLVLFAVILTVRSWFPLMMKTETLTETALPEENERLPLEWQMDYYQSKGDTLTETVFFDGYAFSPDADYSHARHTYLYFISEKKVYRTEASTVGYHLLCQTEGRVNNYDRYIEAFAALEPLTEKRFGFSAEFSTLNMADGIYELGIGVLEGDGSEGFTRTGIHFQKKNVRFFIVPSADIPEFPGDPNVARTSGLQGGMDHAQVLAGREIFIEGTAEIEGVPMDGAKVIVEAQDEHHTTIYFETSQDGMKYRSVIPGTAGLNGTVILRAFVLLPDGSLYLCPKDRAVVL